MANNQGFRNQLRVLTRSTHDLTNRIAHHRSKHSLEALTPSIIMTGMAALIDEQRQRDNA